jgi:hypothetical protein
MSERAVKTALGCVFVGMWMVPQAASAGRYDPYAVVPRGPIVIDMAKVVASPQLPEPQEQPDLSALRETPEEPRPAQAGRRNTLPDGWVQLGEVVQREEVALGIAEVSPDPDPAWEDLEGNQYPRKHTLFMNFNGGKLYNGADNSAENRSSLAGADKYPAFLGSESSALAVIQAVQADMATLGVVVAYEKRPNKTLPYTMAMVSGSWEDTNLEEPAGGVAPGTDCEARGQRHVVYVFDRAASTVGQEAAHSWGLDHTIGSDRIMSYEGGSNKHFGDNCQPLCEEGCQGPGSIGCRAIHEKYCGVGSEAQNDLAELGFIFGTNEPDTEPPEVDIVAPAEDVVVVKAGASVAVQGSVHDNYGGVGWRLVIVKDGETVTDQVDYDKVLAWNLSSPPNGVYEVILEAEDHFGHVVSDKVTLYVGVEAPMDSESGGTGGEEGSEGSGEVPTSDGIQPSTTMGSETDPGGGGDDGASDGGCRISPHAGGAAGLLAPLLGLGLAWRARRRR